MSIKKGGIFTNVYNVCNKDDYIEWYQQFRIWSSGFSQKVALKHQTPYFKCVVICPNNLQSISVFTRTYFRAKEPAPLFKF